MTISDPPPPRKESELRAAFWKQVSSFPEGHKIKNCLQCGTCTGTCPVSYAMDLTPRELVALFRAGHIEEILRSRAIWICASCYACTVRCPVGIHVTDTMYALKRLAMASDLYPDDFPVNRLAKQFMTNVYHYGRNYELGLGAHYYLKAKPSKLMASAGFGMKMMKVGRLGVTPKAIKKIDEVRAIIDRAQKSGGM